MGEGYFKLSHFNAECNEKRNDSHSVLPNKRFLGERFAMTLFVINPLMARYVFGRLAKGKGI
jgi:hypothetical protein